MNAIHGLLYCEFHDGTASSIHIGNRISALIEIDRLNCYVAKPEEEGVASIWSYGAELMFTGFRTMTLGSFSATTLSSAQNIADAVFRFPTEDSSDKYNLTLLEGRELVEAAIVFSDGSRVSFTGGTCRLSVRDRIEFIEDYEWDEPGATPSR